MIFRPYISAQGPPKSLDASCFDFVKIIQYDLHDVVVDVVQICAYCENFINVEYFLQKPLEKAIKIVYNIHEDSEKKQINETKYR